MKVFSYSLLIIIFLLGLVYLVYPSPRSIEQIPALPDSLKSTEPGDTVQNPNIAAYYSDLRRDFVTQYYRQSFENLSILGLKIPAIRTNRPPEEAYAFIRDQQRSTYLEEYSYPLRDALFVNGYEPFDLYAQPFDGKSYPLIVNDQLYQTKTTIRYYPSVVPIRVAIYILSWLSVISLVVVTKRLLKYQITPK